MPPQIAALGLLPQKQLYRIPRCLLREWIPQKIVLRELRGGQGGSARNHSYRLLGAARGTLLAVPQRRDPLTNHTSHILMTPCL